MSKTLTILVVDDDIRLHRTYQKLLGNQNVVAVDSPQAAEAWVDEGHQPDVIISDYLMAGDTGLAVMKLAAERFSRVPRYIATGTPAEVDEETGLLAELVIEKGSTAFLQCMADLNSMSRKRLNLAVVDLLGAYRKTSFNTPDYYKTIEGEYDEHPFDAELSTLLGTEPLASEIMHAHQASVTFEKELSRENKADYLEVERISTSTRIVENQLAFNIGIEHGAVMQAVTAGLKKGGIPVDDLSRKALFRISRAVGEIAEEIYGPKQNRK